MTEAIKAHFKKTGELAYRLKRPQIYEWLVTRGYFPESYVLPPCFEVTKHPVYGKRFFDYTKTAYRPKITEFQQVHFPRTELTDRTFGIIDPEIHSDIAYTITKNWKTFLNAIFHSNNKVLC